MAVGWGLSHLPAEMGHSGAQKLRVELALYSLRLAPHHSRTSNKY